MKLALAQINPTVGDFAGNEARIIDFARRAAAQGAELVLFSELCISGYPPADLLEKPSFLAGCRASLERIATALPGIAVLVGYPAVSADTPKRVANAAALLHDGRVIFEQHKMLLPYYDVFDEQRYFQPAAGQRLVEFGGRRIAVTICEDAWNDKDFWPRRRYDADPVEALLDAGADLVVNLSASPFWAGKAGLRRRMLATIARAHGVPVAMTNQVGGNDSLIFDGNSFVVGPDGEVLASAAAFAEDLVLCDIPAAPQRAGSEKAVSVAPQTDSLPENDIGSVYDALVLGTRDYVRKCGFSRAIVAISGGLDSALVATIAADALGRDNVTGVMLPSQYSSGGSVDDALRLAENLGMAHEKIAIEPSFHALEAALAPVFRGRAADLTEENLQSRIRGTLVMAISNKTGALVLTTGNKSEMAVGYATLYGDMAGGLAVIGDVFKTDCYRLARYANRNGERIPQATIDKAPSAELRPGQLDVDSLPPYDVLDPILRMYVEQYCTAEQIAAFTGQSAELVRQVLKLVERSEYKRQQAAPVLKVTPKSFGPGRRFPIAARWQL